MLFLCLGFHSDFNIVVVLSHLQSLFKVLANTFVVISIGNDRSFLDLGIQLSRRRPHLILLVEVDFTHLLNFLIFLRLGPNFRKLPNLSLQKFHELEILPKQIGVFLLGHHILLQFLFFFHHVLQKRGKQEVVVNLIRLAARFLLLQALHGLIKVPIEDGGLLFAIDVIIENAVIES